MRLGAVASVLTLGAVGLTACGTPKQRLNEPGSDTIQDVNAKLASLFNASGQASTDNDQWYTPPAVFDAQHPSPYNIPSDNHCSGNAVDYNTGSPPPNGSSAGISALRNDDNQAAAARGCVDFARSSRNFTASKGDTTDLEFWAFARDAVTWSWFNVSGRHQPTNLTKAQIKGIYECSTSTHKPQFTNWNQVGGTTAGIIRYLPQNGSGTLAFFEKVYLDDTSADPQAGDDGNCSTKPTRIEENHGDQVTAANQPSAIMPYSYAVWTAQKNGVVTDHRSTAQLGLVNGIGPSQTTISNGTFLGWRSVFNVLQNNTLSHGSPDYGIEKNIVGVNSGGPGWLCTGSEASTISQYGFVPYATGTTGSGLPNSACRLNPAQ
jgi:hypothetical protein